MGRKRNRTARKWRKNGEDTEEAALAAIRNQHSKTQLKETPNDDLFVIDTGKQKKLVKKSNQKATPSDQVARRVAKNKKKSNTRITRQSGSKDESIFNLWAGSAKDTRVNRRAKRRDRKIVKNSRKIKDVVVPSAGISYNPSKDAHQDAMAEAVAKEYARAERLEQEKLPEPTNAIPIDDNCTTDEDADEDDEVPVEGAKKDLVHRSLKKTRAKRHREKRAKIQEIERKKKKSKTQLNHQMLLTRKINKELSAAEVVRSERHSLRLQLRHEALVKPIDRIVRIGGKKRKLEPVPDVALSEELEGSLLKMKPRGNVLTDRWHSMLERNKFELGDKERIRRLKKAQRKAHKTYGKAHWGPKAMIRDAEKRVQPKK